MSKRGRHLWRVHVGENFSEGARQLWVIKEKNQLSAEDIGRVLGVSRGMPGRWLYGDQRPEREFAMKIWRLYGIDPASWDDPPRKHFILPAARKVA